MRAVAALGRARPHRDGRTARNIVVHRYLDVDPAIVRSVLVTNLGDFGAFVQSIRARLTELQG